MKKKLKELISAYTKHVGSANRAAVSLGVSAATISYLNSGQDEKVSDEMCVKLLEKLELWDGMRKMDDTVLAPFRKLMTYDQPQVTKRKLMDLMLEQQDKEALALLRQVYDCMDEATLNVIKLL